MKTRYIVWEIIHLKDLVSISSCILLAYKQPYSLKLSALLFIATYLLSPGFSQRDYTYEDLANGKDVTETVIRRIANANIFPEDHTFYIRLAYVESLFGAHNSTFRANYTGGIWQVDEEYYEKTHGSNLAAYHIDIRNNFDLNWTASTTWRSSLAPMYSGLAAVLYFAQLPVHIPGKLSEQAAHWKKYYRPNGNVNDFIDAANELRNETVCRGKMDLVIVLGGSSSVGVVNFERAKNFVATMIECFTLDFTRIGMITYSNQVESIFHLNDNLTIAVMVRKAKSAPYPSGGTNTDAAIRQAVTMHNETKRIDGVPQIIAVLTDGENTGPDLPGAVNEMARNKLLPISIGITNQINYDELKFIALNDTRRLFTVSDFEALQDLVYQVTSITCEIPQKPTINGSYEDSLVANEKRLYEIEIPDTGLTINLTVSTGKTMGYWSKKEQVPNSAVHDGIIDEATYIPPETFAVVYEEEVNKTTAFVYVAIQGVDPMNNYTLETKEGNHAPTDPPTPPTTTTIKPTTDGATTTSVNVVLFAIAVLIGMPRLRNMFS